MKRNIKWYDWIPIIGIISGLYSNARCSNWIVVWMWSMYQAFLTIILLFIIAYHTIHL